MLISIETHISCDFPGGPDPLSPSGSAQGINFRVTLAWQSHSVSSRVRSRRSNTLDSINQNTSPILFIFLSLYVKIKGKASKLD